MKVPILILAFNRADHVKIIMESIREYKPERVYLECDGARPHKAGEKEAVEATRKTMLDMVDWPCEVKTLFREENWGCANGVNDAITWFFKHEEYGIICEDDIVLHQDFFKLCEECLPRFKDNDRIMMVCAHNPIPVYSHPNELYFTNNNLIWGWASWRRAWDKMDMQMKSWPSISKLKLFKEWGIIRASFQYFRWKDVYKHLDTCTSWATRWNYAIFANNGLNISANVNLMKNIGLTEGTHYSKFDINPYSHLKFGGIQWPIVYPEKKGINHRTFCRLEIECLRMKSLALLKRIRMLLNKVQ